MKTTLLLCLLFAAAISAMAQGPSGGGQPSMEQAIQNNMQMLSGIRANPQSKSQALERM